MEDARYDTVVVLRAYGDRVDVDACLTWLPSSRVDRVWRKGESRRGRVKETSGFNVLLAEGIARECVVQDAADAFVELAERIAELTRGGAEAVVDFGLFLAVDGEPFNLSLPPAAVAVFERAGAAVVVSAYPVTDENREFDEEASEEAYEGILLDEQMMEEDDRTNARVLLRVYDDQLDPEACRTWLPSNLPSRVWRSGERDSRGRVKDGSGFDVEIATGPAHGPVVEEAADAFRELAEPIAELVQRGADAKVYFAVLLYVRRAPASLYFEPHEAAVFARAGVTLVVRAHTKVPTAPSGELT